MYRSPIFGPTKYNSKYTQTLRILKGI